MFRFQTTRPFETGHILLIFLSLPIDSRAVALFMVVARVGL
jgi:hypothetical protein